MYFICTESFYCGNCLGKKYFQGWKMYFGCFNRIFRSFLTLLDFLLGLIDQFTERKRECCTFRPGNCYYLILFDTLFFNILSWVLLLNDCLKRRSPHIIAKLDEHITFVSFWKVFLMPLSWLFLYGIFAIRAYYIFLRYKPTFHRYGHRVRFFCNNERKSIQQFYINKKSLIVFKNGKLFLRNFQKLPITSKVSWIPDTGCFRICLQHNRP